MRVPLDSEVVDPDRRELLSTAARAAAGVASLLSIDVASAATGDAIRPFRINIPEEDLADLRRRVLAARWPELFSAELRTALRSLRQPI